MKKRNHFNNGKRNVMRIGALVIACMLTVSTLFVQGGTTVAYAQSSVSSDVLSKTINKSNIPGTVTTQSKYNDSFLSVTGFASIEGNITDRSNYVGTQYYRTVNNEREFLDALIDAQSGLVKVIEITKDMNLGYNELNLTSDERKKYSMVSKYGAPNNELNRVNGGFTNPLMQVSGVTKISLSNIKGLTIFSQNGRSIKHTELKLNSPSSDIVIRNLNFKEMWQWDDKGSQKEVGWSNLKINGAKNVWVDHCSFEMASDGNIDMENGSSGITISWCAVGIDATENPSEDSSLYQSIMFMEGRYQKNELKPDTSLYYQLRNGGATPQQIMAYSAYHKKCHLTGSGDKDFVNYVKPDGTVVADANSNLSLTLAYNHYSNVGQRVPMIRQGVGNLINCYIDNSTHVAAEAASPILGQIGPYHLSRGLNSRDGASIAADTCVFNGIEEPITGSEVQGDDIANMSAQWAHLFQNAYNHVLIANSTVTNSQGTYTGSSWDNSGENLFTTGFNWKDKSTLGKWAWYSSIVGKETYSKETPPLITDAPFEFTYDSETGLPFEYQVLPLEDVKGVVTEKSGSNVIEMSAAEWLMTAYLADADYSVVNTAIDKANSLNASDYVDFTAVTNAMNTVEKGLKSDEQERVATMATAIENAINSLVKITVEDSTQEPASTVSPTSTVSPASPETADKGMLSMYTLFLCLSVGVAGMAASLRKKTRVNK
ncbi:pectate lyase family protein [[Clostridium] fimetarium]|uniref:Pectate lyase n=1 Tax=[Clostridium] fimetarium TaxID=99656 RepID=A0A1I0RS09_9FIRM|nr:hypothetical protein [[Clostridium] fimetarium]SEW43589.1 Pectate lyase [[Clostridium] fimetarium]